MQQRARLVIWSVIGILLILGVLGYRQGWFGTIFGAILGTDLTATIDQSNFTQEGTYEHVIQNQGALELERLPEG
ncbi:hypothetical protein HY375_03725 [Candidatus Berkelbacteria bacterium]|nr:hypothetical protein [Candidatus Berkelbacteria bacterium]